MHAIKIIFLFSILSTTALAESNFYQQTKLRWLSAVSIKVNPNIVMNEQIKEPRGSFVVLFELQLLTMTSKLVKDCVIVKIPASNSNGLIKVVTMSIRERCKDGALRKGSILQEKVFDIGYSHKANQLKLVINTEELKYKFFNIKGKTKYKLYDSSFTSTSFPGLSVSFVSNSTGTAIAEGQICYDVDDQCNDVITDTCQLCPEGILLSKASSCNRKFRKYCMSASCGTKGKPACLRGHITSNYQGDYCIPGSPLGFCIAPNQVYCENGELLCR